MISLDRRPRSWFWFLFRVVACATLVSFGLPRFAVAADLSRLELVMNEGTKIAVKTSRGKVTIAAGNGLNRTYSWRECSLTSEMWPRLKRWYGSLGAYNAAPQGFLGGLIARKCEGVSRAVVEEGQIHFNDGITLVKWLLTRVPAETTVWTNDGLVFSWLMTPGRNQLNVNLFQICIGGYRPNKLPSSSDQAFTILNPNSSPARRSCVSANQDVIQHTQEKIEEQWSELAPGRRQLLERFFREYVLQ